MRSVSPAALGGYLIGTGLMLCGLALVLDVVRRWRLARRRARAAGELRHPVYRPGRVPARPVTPRQSTAAQTLVLPRVADDVTALLPRLADRTELFPLQRAVRRA